MTSRGRMRLVGGRHDEAVAAASGQVGVGPWPGGGRVAVGEQYDRELLVMGIGATSRTATGIGRWRRSGADVAARSLPRSRRRKPRSRLQHWVHREPRTRWRAPRPRRGAQAVETAGPWSPTACPLITAPRCANRRPLPRGSVLVGVDASRGPSPEGVLPARAHLPGLRVRGLGQ